jgi:integrase
MPKLLDNRVPSYRRHKQSGQAIVTLDGRDILLGPHGTGASKAEYRRRVAEWIANGRRLRKDESNLTVAELIAVFKDHAEKYYRKTDGTPTSEVDNFRYALRPLRELYGSIDCRDFGPLALEAVRNVMIQRGWVRTSINTQIGRIKHLFSWAVSRELLPASVYQALTTVSGLRSGRTEALESEPVRPVPEEAILAILPFLSPTLAAMVQLQWATGARPGEICQLRTGDINRSGDVWEYELRSHKTQHHGHRRTIFIGRRGQEVLGPFLNMNPDAYCFSPAVAEVQRRASASEARKTPLNSGNVPGSNNKRDPKRKPGACYDTSSYRRAISRACDQAFPPPAQLLTKGNENQLAAWRKQHRWHPHQIRHTAATQIRRRFGIEAAQHVLGHASLSITELYAEKDAAVAKQIAAAIG